MLETLLSGRVDMGLFPQPFYGAMHASGDVKTLFRLNDQIDALRAAAQRLPARLRRGQRAGDRASPRRTGRGSRSWIARAGEPQQGDRGQHRRDQDPRGRAGSVPAHPGGLLPAADGAVSVDALQEESDFFRERGGIQQDLQVSDHVIDELLPPRAAVLSRSRPQVSPAACARSTRRRRGERDRDRRARLQRVAGEFVSIVGPSGCGKSTLPLHPRRLRRAHRPRGTVDGRRSAAPTRRAASSSRSSSLFPWKTVLGNVAYGLAEQGVPRRERAARARRYIDLVELARLRGPLPEGALRRHEAARRARAVADRGPQHPAHERAVRRRRRPDAGHPAARAAARSGSARARPWCS